MEEKKKRPEPAIDPEVLPLGPESGFDPPTSLKGYTVGVDTGKPDPPVKSIQELLKSGLLKKGILRWRRSISI